MKLLLSQSSHASIPCEYNGPVELLQWREPVLVAFQFRVHGKKEHMWLFSGGSTHLTNVFVLFLPLPFIHSLSTSRRMSYIRL